MRYTVKIFSTGFLLLSIVFATQAAPASATENYPSLYQEVRLDYSPSDDRLATLNPPNLQWPRRRDFRIGEAGNDRFDPPRKLAKEELF